jgi:nucleoside-diphosphate-sugar epimerase
MIYGTSRDRNMARLLRFLKRSPVVPLPGGGHGLQQPVNVDDLADAVLSCIERPASIHHVYNIAGPEPLTLRELVQEAARAVGRRLLIVPVPLRATIAAARWLERTRLVPVGAEQLGRLAEDKAFDITPARRDLEYRPRPFSDGIDEEARSMR